MTMIFTLDDSRDVARVRLIRGISVRLLSNKQNNKYDDQINSSSSSNKIGDKKHYFVSNEIASAVNLFGDDDN
jgi:hypothetical protein